MKFFKLTMQAIMPSAALSLLILVGAGCVDDCHWASRHNETMSRSFNVQPGGELIVDVHSASVDITTGQERVVKVDVFLGAHGRSESQAKEMLKEYNLVMEQKGDDVLISAKKAHGIWNFGRNGRYDVRLKIVIPVRYNVDISTSGGGVSIRELDGSAVCHTSGGDLTLGSVTGNLKLETSGGSVRVGDVGGDADIETSGGDIRLGKISGDLKAETSGGGIHTGEVMGVLHAETSGGSIHSALGAQPDGDCSLETSGGGVTILLNPALNLDISASTSGGSVHNDFASSEYRNDDHSEFNGSINKGGPRLHLSTSGGSIYIRKAN